MSQQNQFISSKHNERKKNLKQTKFNERRSREQISSLAEIFYDPNKVS